MLPRQNLLHLFVASNKRPLDPHAAGQVKKPALMQDVTIPQTTDRMKGHPGKSN